jgi:DNA-binding CsgD family transcriptional regulator
VASDRAGLTGLVGRDAELARLGGLVDPPPARSEVLVLLGDAGAGKTVVLDEVARRAAAAGLAVRAAAGRESEQDLAFAGLHQLLRPVLGRVAGLPARQADALRGAFGLADQPVPPDALLTGLAVLTLLSDLAGERPLLVAVDDAQWLDRGSLDALAFAARRFGDERLVLLVGVRGAVPPAGFERDFAELRLGPLSRQDAGRLLDAQPRPPRGRAREQVLVQAEGNPMALIELSRAIAADPAAGRRWAAEPLPLTDRLTALLAAQFRGLPGASREALLVAAVANSGDGPAAGAGAEAGAEAARSGGVAGLPGLSLGVLAPAETAGLIRAVAGWGPQFTHPLVRAAVYHAVPFADRAAAHLRVAETLRDQPDRYAWHLAAAALEPDERTAALLEETAAVAQRRGGAAAAARALERAAQLSPAEPDRARRLLAAAGLARQAGQADWVREMCTGVLTLTADPGLRLAARLSIGWALVWSDQHADALATLLSVAADAAGPWPEAAADALALAATVAYQTGGPADRQAVLLAMDRILVPAGQADGQADEQAGGPAGQPASGPGGFPGEYRLWIRACAEPVSQQTAIRPLLHEIAAGAVSDHSVVGAAAWLLDETELAVRLLREAISRLRAPGVRSASGAVLSALQWACIDSGRWDEALAAAREASDAAAAYKMESVAASADLATATVLILRGEHDTAWPLLARAGATVDAAGYRAFAARTRHAAGLSALAQGRYADAYDQLRLLFGADGEPLHHHVSYLGLADLAAAAARAGHRREARTLLGRALPRLAADGGAADGPAGGAIGELAGPRLAQLIARARGLLAAPADAEPHFAAAVADPAGAAWPFERAQAQLGYGEWLRRQRRINDAKPVLTAALETFRRLDAAPWSRRAEAELRACGVAAAAAAAPDGGGLAALTPQQREIAVLAGRGLTNGEIADRLYLSPRTVASHLYRSYPKLGIAGRHQLAALIARSGTDPGPGPGGGL